MLNIFSITAILQKQVTENHMAIENMPFFQGKEIFFTYLDSRAFLINGKSRL